MKWLAARGISAFIVSVSPLVSGMMLAVLVLSPAIAIAKIWFATDINYVEPRKELAREATRIWHETTASPLLYVAGSQRYENAVAFYSTDQPHVFSHLDFHLAPWVTAEDLDRSGLLVVCAKEDRKCSDFDRQHNDARNHPNRVDCRSLLLGLPRTAVELHHNRNAAASLKSLHHKGPSTLSEVQRHL